LTSDLSRRAVRTNPDDCARMGSYAAQMDGSHTPSDDDHRLLELANAVLVDPQIHTDTRMRLHAEISELLRTTAHEHGYWPPGSKEQRRVTATTPEEMAGLLESVLTDPNLHTDTRMRLHRELRDILEPALEPAQNGSVRNRPSR
jgi:hypothetical protein